mmetsp:Transcript_20163/g.63666  ORF Transcript_20163/g.63666 Transcript_20163/m.63666 type:complete len:154 (-) Transcript_20163:1087-1548(-)
MDRGALALGLAVTAVTIFAMIRVVNHVSSPVYLGKSSSSSLCNMTVAHDCRIWGVPTVHEFHTAAVAAGWPCRENPKICLQNNWIPPERGCPSDAFDYVYEYGRVYGVCFHACPRGCARLPRRDCACGPPAVALEHHAVSVKFPTIASDDGIV